MYANDTIDAKTAKDYEVYLILKQKYYNLSYQLKDKGEIYGDSVIVYDNKYLCPITQSYKKTMLLKK